MEVFGCGTAAIVSPVGGLKWVQKCVHCTCEHVSLQFIHPRYEGELFSVPTPQYGLAARILEQLTGQICAREILKLDILLQTSTMAGWTMSGLWTLRWLL